MTASSTVSRVMHVTTVSMTLRFLRHHARAARAMGLDVVGVASPSPDLAATGTACGMRTIGVPMQRRISPIADARAVLELLRVIRSERPAIVHAHTPKAGLLAMVAARLARVPLRVYTIHGLPLETARPFTRMLLGAAERVASSCAHDVHCVGASLARVVEARRLSPLRQPVVFGAGSIAGVDAVDEFNPVAPRNDRRTARLRYGLADDDVVVGFVGRLVKDKGVEELAVAWNGVRRRRARARLLLVGPVEARNAVEARVLDGLRADDRVTCLGWQEDLAPIYAAMDLCVLPSYREGFPVTLLEAAAMALPVVATTATGCVDAVVHGTTGTLVPPHDAAALEAAIDTYVANPELRRRHGLAGRERALRDFEPTAIARATVQRYLALLDRTGTWAPAPSGQASVRCQG